MVAKNTFVRFDKWEDVLEAARKGELLWYEAPMDAASARPVRLVSVVRVFNNGKLRIDSLNKEVDSFTADAGHLYRFRRIAT